MKLPAQVRHAGQVTNRRRWLHRFKLWITVVALTSIPSVGCSGRHTINPYVARKKEKKTWVCAASPRVTIKACEGTINVYRTAPGIIESEITFTSLSWESDAAANRGIEGGYAVTQAKEGLDYFISIDQLSDSILQARVEVGVPDGAFLEVRTESGDVWVGYNGDANATGSNAIAPSSLTARQSGVGSLGVNLVVPPSTNVPLDLEGEPLKITINGSPIPVGQTRTYWWPALK